MEELLIFDSQLGDQEFNVSNKDRKIKISAKDIITVFDFKAKKLVDLITNNQLDSIEKELVKEDNPVVEEKEKIEVKPFENQILPIENKFNFDAFEEPPVPTVENQELETEVPIQSADNLSYSEQMRVITEKAEGMIKILYDKIDEIKSYLKENDINIKENEEKLILAEEDIKKCEAALNNIQKISDETQKIDIKAIQDADALQGKRSLSESVDYFGNTLVSLKKQVDTIKNYLEECFAYKNKLKDQTKKIDKQIEKILVDQLKQSKDLLEKLNHERFEILKPMEKIQNQLMELKKKNTKMISNVSGEKEKQIDPEKKVVSIKSGGNPFSNLRSDPVEDNKQEEKFIDNKNLDISKKSFVSEDEYKEDEQYFKRAA